MISVTTVCCSSTTDICSQSRLVLLSRASLFSLFNILQARASQITKSRQYGQEAFYFLKILLLIFFQNLVNQLSIQEFSVITAL